MKSKVYYTKNNFSKIVDLIPKDLKGKTGIKVHVGEMGNVTYLNPKHALDVYNRLSGTNKNLSLVECNVLYRGSRSNRKDHLKTAKAHGFDFIELDILDGEVGADSWEIPINGKHFKQIKVGSGLQKYKNLIILSHFKGHGANGFGGALKNLGMGLGSRAGKMAMHAAFKLKIDKNICVGCGICAAKCPAEAITVIDRIASIDFSKCIRCAGCITNCPNGAVIMPWGGSSSAELQERISEYCLGITENVNCAFYINVLENITDKCDCYGIEMKPLIPDLGFLASTDPVALDKACLDLIKKSTGKDLFRSINSVDCKHQVEYAEKIGLGKVDYEFIEL
jgi:uncharacterized Fe-S center protein